MLLPAPRRRVARNTTLPSRPGEGICSSSTLRRRVAAEKPQYPKMQLCLPALQEQNLWVFSQPFAAEWRARQPYAKHGVALLRPLYPGRLRAKEHGLRFSILIYTVGHLEHLETCILTESVLLLSTHHTPWTPGHVGQGFLFRGALRLTLSEIDVDSHFWASTPSPEVCVLFGH